VLLLDEPTEGLEPEARHHLLALVRALASDGRTVIHATRHAGEIEPLAPRQVAVLVGGTVRFAGPPCELSGRGLGPAHRQLLDRERQNVPAS
jgi:ABC-type multidrug transport system ATPase subunit